MIRYSLKHENAQEPVRGSNWAAGFDLHAAEKIRDTKHELWYDTGVAFAIPSGMYGDLRARSSVSEMGLTLANGAGVIDADFRGTIQFRFYKIGQTRRKEWSAGGEEYEGYFPAGPSKYEVGDRVGQIVITPCYKGEIDEAEKLSDTSRGQGSFGSTGQ